MNYDTYYNMWWWWFSTKLCLTLVTPWTVAHQAPLPMGFSRQEYLKVKVTQLYPTLCDPMDYSPPGSSAHGILQARILEWVAIPFSTEHGYKSINDGAKS